MTQMGRLSDGRPLKLLLPWWEAKGAGRTNQCTVYQLCMTPFPQIVPTEAGIWKLPLLRGTDSERELTGSRKAGVLKAIVLNLQSVSHLGLQEEKSCRMNSPQ